MKAPLIHLKSTDSTNKELQRRLSLASLADGAALLADFQTQGRGRLKRAWASEAGRNMLCSFWCALDLPPGRLCGFSLLPALAVLDYLDTLPLRASCKWPNDIRWNGRKLCGILTECIPARSGGKIRGAIVGIGLNLQSAPELPDVPSPPVSLREILARDIPCEEAAESIQEKLFGRKQLWLAGIQEEQMHEWITRCDHMNIPTRITVNGNKVMGTMRGLGRNGQLLLELEGRIQEVWADDVIPLHAASPSSFLSAS